MKSFATSICPIKKSSRSEYEASPRHPRAIPAWQIGLLPNVGRFGAFFMDIEVLIGCSSRSSARRPCLQVLQSHLRVAKQSSIGPLARRPCPEVSHRHLRVADHHPTDLKTVSFRCHNRSSARRSCLQAPQRHTRVAKRSSDRSSARRPCPEVSQRHPRVAKRSSDRSLARRPCPEVSQRHLRVAK